MYTQKRCAHSKVNFRVSSHESTCEPLQVGLFEIQNRERALYPCAADIARCLAQISHFLGATE
jgi:hypothetical protein